MSLSLEQRKNKAVAEFNCSLHVISSRCETLTNGHWVSPAYDSPCVHCSRFFNFQISHQTKRLFPCSAQNAIKTGIVTANKVDPRSLTQVTTKGNRCVCLSLYHARHSLMIWWLLLSHLWTSARTE